MKKYTYNNGINEKKFSENDIIPDGWIKGRILHKYICKRCNKEFLSTYPTTVDYCNECKSYSDGNVCKICGKPAKNKKRTCGDKNCIHQYLSENNAMKNDENVRKKCIDAKYKKWGGKENYDKHFHEKYETTMMKRYNVKHALHYKLFKDKLEETIKKTGKSGRFHTPEWNAAMLEKYETTIPYQVEEIKNKGMQTLQDHYGVTIPMRSEIIREKSKQTCLERYDVEYSFQSENNKEKSRITMLKRYGVENTLCLHSSISKLNKKIGEFLDVDEYEYCIDLKRYDLKKGNYLIEINPVVSHSIDKTFFGGIDISYHVNKTNLARENGFKCINIWDWDDINKVKYLISLNKKILNISDCKIRLVDKKSSDLFLNNYNLYGSDDNDIIRIAIIYNYNIIGIMTFGTFSNNWEYQLLRSCFSPDYYVINGYNELFYSFIQNFNPDSVIAYCDNSKFSGNSYIKMGMSLLYKNDPIIHWQHINKKIHFTNDEIKQFGADKLLKVKNDENIDNETLMLNNNFYRVADCGYSIYGYINNHGCKDEYKLREWEPINLTCDMFGG